MIVVLVLIIVFVVLIVIFIIAAAFITGGDLDIAALESDVLVEFIELDRVKVVEGVFSGAFLENSAVSSVLLGLSTRNKFDVPTTHM